MTTNQKLPGRLRPGANREPISIQAEIADDYEEAVTEPMALAPVATEQVAAEPVAVTPMAAEEVAAELGEIKAVAVSIAATLGALPSGTSPQANKSDAEFDLRAWPLNVFALFSANASAVLDFAAALGQAKSLTDAIELQARFASERYSTLLRQTNEIAELMRCSTFNVSSPVHLTSPVSNH
jgi:hypothetical protein